MNGLVLPPDVRLMNAVAGIVGAIANRHPAGHIASHCVRRLCRFKPCRSVRSAISGCSICTGSVSAEKCRSLRCKRLAVLVHLLMLSMR